MDMLRRALPVVLVLSACGDVSLLNDNLAPVPSITAFVAAPAVLGAGGGTSLLTWTVVNENNLSLEPGAGNVTGYTKASMTLTATTTYTLSASNSLGETSSTLTVTVGP